MTKKIFKIFLVFLLLSSLFAFNSPVLAQDMVWSTPEKINTSQNHALLPTIVTGPNGYLHAAWMELTPGEEEFWSGLPTPGIFYSYWNGDTWSTPFKVSQNTSWTGFPGIAVTSDNHVHIVYEDDSEIIPTVWGRILYREYDGSSWSSPVSLSQDTPDSWAWAPKIVRDKNNNLHTIFNFSNYTDYKGVELYYRKYEAGSWSTPERLTVKGGIEDGLEHSDLTVDPNNYPHVILWEDGIWSGDPERGIYHTYFNGVSWQTPYRLSTDGKYPKIAIDNQGYRHVIWVIPYLDQVGGWKNRVEYKKWDGAWSATPTEISSSCTYSPWLLPITGVTYDSKNNVYVGWGERVGWTGNPGKGVEVSYKKWNGSSWENPVFMRKAYDLDTPFLYRDIWDNQHLTWAEENETTRIWEFWYSVVPINIKTYNPASAFLMTLNITNDTLSIPAGALATTTNISAQIGPLPASANPAYTTLPRSFTYRPHGITFAAKKEATAVIYYTDAEMIGTDERNMKVYIWDGQANAWSTSFATSVNTAQNKATVTLPHFSLFGVMAPKVKVNWLPPIAKAELYELKEGSTLPVKFTLTHYDGTPLSAPELAEDVRAVVKKVDKEIKSYTFGTSGDSVRYDPDTGQYIFNIHTKELNLGKGAYSVEVLIFGQDEPTQTTQFTIVEPGKVRGTATP